MRDDLWEHTDSVENGSEDCWDLLNEGIGGEEKRVLLGPLLDELLVLVEGLKSVEVHNINADVLFLDDLEMLGVSDKADLELGSWDVWKSDGTGESLVFLWVVVLETDLEFNSFNELSLLLVLQDLVDTFADLGLGDVFAHI